MTNERFNQLKVHSSHTKNDVLDIDRMKTMLDPCPHCGGNVWVQGNGACCQSCGRMARLNFRPEDFE